MTSSIRIPLLLVFLLVGLTHLSEAIYTPSLPSVAEDLKTSMNLAEATVGTYFLGFAFGVFYWGYLCDQIGRRSTMLIGLVTYIIGTILCLFSDSVTFLITSRIIQGFGAGACSVVTLTMLRDIYDGHERHKLFATISTVLALAPAVGPFIGGFIAESFHYRGNFVVLLLFGITLLIYSLLKLPETRPEGTRKVPLSEFYDLFKTMIRDPYVLTFATMIGIINGIWFSYYAEAPSLFIEQLGFSEREYGIIGLFVAVPSLLGAQLCRILLKSISAERIILYGTLIILLGAGSLICITLPLATIHDAATSIYLITSMSIIFLGIGATLPNCLSLALVHYKHAYGKAGALLGLIYVVETFLFITVMNIIHNGTFLPMPIYFVALAGLMVYLGMRIVRHTAKHPHPATA